MNNINEIPSDELPVLEISENDYKSAKDRMKEQLNIMAKINWFETIEQYVASKTVNMIWSEKLWRSDDIMLKALRFIWDIQWRTTSSKDFTIKSNIPYLDNKSLVSY